MMDISRSTTIYFHGWNYQQVSDVIQAFMVAGVDSPSEALKLVEDFDATALEYKAQALAAEAKLNRIKTLLKD